MKRKSSFSEELALYKNLFNLTDEGLAICELIYDDNNQNNFDFRYLEVNPAFEKFVGTKPYKLKGKTGKEFGNLESKWIELFEKVVSTGRTGVLEDYSVLTGKWVKLRAFNLEGNKFGILFIDLTERKELENSISANSKELLKILSTLETILDTIPVGIVVAEAGSENIVFHSSAANGIMGLSLSNKVTGHVSSISESAKMLLSDGSEIPPTEWPWVRALRFGEPTRDKEIIIQNSNGREAAILINCIPVRNQEGKISQAIASIIDITERKEIEKVFLEYTNKIVQARDEAEHRAAELDATIASIAAGVIIYNNSGNIIRINEFAKNLTGLTTIDYNLPLIDRLHKLNVSKFNGIPYKPEETPLYRALHGEIVRDEEMIVYSNPTEPVWISTTTAPIYDNCQKLIGVTFIFIDITGRKQESQATITNILESITDAFYSLDRNFCFTYLNEEAKRLSFWNEGLIGKCIWEVYPKDKYPDYYEQLHKATREQRAIHFQDYFLNKCFEFHIYPSSQGLSVYYHEITDRVKFEEELQHQRELLLITLNSLDEGVIATDEDERIILINDVATKLIGYSRKETLGKFLNEVLYIIDDKTSERLIITAPQKVLSNFILVTRDLEEIPVSIHSLPIKANEDLLRGRIIIFQDITEKQKTEQELSRTEKLESLGVLAGGIAHDFNNILAAILANIQLALIKQQKNEENKKYLMHTVEITRKASELTKQLLTFSKGGAPVKKDASLNELIQDTAKFVLRGTKTKAIFNFVENLWGACIDEGQISQVIHNLVLNAKQAMPKGGIIRILAENVVIDSHSHFQTGKYVKITVKDEGIGIPKEIIPKIFDPFFTTKKEGNGLGLATSYSIIKKHNGYIEVESQVDTGTSFIIYLPAIDLLPEKEFTPNEVAASGAGLKVLLMDDEVQILNAVSEMLKYNGYRVEAALDGSEAIAIYQQAKATGDPFDVVIMDLTIPGGLGGQETIAILRDIDPNINAIVSSGYANDLIIADYERFGFKGVVIKPYKFDELHEVLNKVAERKQLGLNFNME